MLTKNWSRGSRYRDKKKQIQALVDLDQPFALAKYEVSVPMVTDCTTCIYEIILWQTRNDKDETACLTLSREDYLQLKEDFEMKALCKRKYGELWGVNDSLLRLEKEFREVMTPYDREKDTRHKTYYIPELSRDEKETALFNLKLSHKAKERAEMRFCEDFGIIHWKLTFNKSKDEN